MFTVGVVRKHFANMSGTKYGRFAAVIPGRFLLNTQINVSPPKRGTCAQPVPSPSQPEGRLLMAECPRGFQSATETVLRSIDELHVGGDTICKTIPFRFGCSYTFFQGGLNAPPLPSNHSKMFPKLLESRFIHR